ncbi:MAG: hypothetical protein BGN99_28135 [Alphaproteobacteria bacterium 65-37]|jgi:hypothetical protein|nr:DUF3644 domain-containing protein [Alphaproteobacteria bacterium]OJU33971.1 MAG: hypothetical protein BGN99_28135 [Alphaproteobacteria bacterium 65-37]
MAVRKRGNTLEKWEVAIIKAMIAENARSNDQDILAYFTRPSRSINHRAIAEIRKDLKHKGIRAATSTELDEFRATWPDIDLQTGLSTRGDELLLKAREAMIAAINTFNGLGLTFRSELFIVTAMIAWTYLMHAWFKQRGIDYRYKVRGQVQRTRNGAEMYWELGHCVRHDKCPLPRGVVQNLEFLLELRHEIEHKSTSRIDEAVSAKLQACCINFNDALTQLFGRHYALEKRMPIALQLVTFNTEQRELLKRASNLPQHIETMMTIFQGAMTEEEQMDPRFAYRVAFVPKVRNRASGADLAIDFVKEGSEEARNIARVLLKEVDKKRFTAGQIVKLMQKEGFSKFDMHQHTMLWKKLNARKEEVYGGPGPYRNTWLWFEPWIARVREHCTSNKSQFA